MYPVPAPPVNAFPYIFLAYFAVGLALFVFRRGAAKLVAARPLTEDASIVSMEEPVPA